MKKLTANWRKSSWLVSSSLDTRYALIEACLIGLFSALAALLLKHGIAWLGGWRVQTISLVGSKAVLPLVGFVFGTLAGTVVELLSPAAAGGGIPQVKAALAKYPIVLNFQTAIVKTLATILVIGAGFTLGRRGPTVQIGAALGAQVSRLIPNSFTNRRQMIAAGAAAGLAAGFNTPIAGVLFVIEELMRDISGLTLETAIVASFTGAVVSRLLGTADLNLPLAVLNSTHQSSFAIAEIPFYILLGVLAGILGGIFNRSIIRGMKFSRSLPLPMPLRIGLAGLISGTIIAILPPIFEDNAGLRELVIAGQFSWHTTALVFVAQFCLTIIAYSSGAPGGLFAPALVLGSALGYLVGLSEVALISTESPYTFALAGMGAFFTAVVRVPVTAIVIIFEMTADFNLVLPLMISTAIAYIVAESVSQGSLYQHLLEASGMEITEEHPQNDFMAELTADDVMQSQVETFSAKMTLSEVVKAMSRSHHRGFPVVEEGKLVGIITQSDLPQDSKQVGNVLLGDLMTPKPITVGPDTSLADVLYLLNKYQLSRLPVTEGCKLLGIITRSDIIKAEAKQLNCDHQYQSKGRFEPSYVVYQTHSPATGRGRLLLFIEHRDHIPELLEIVGAIAQYHQYEIEFLWIITIPQNIYPAQAKVDTEHPRQLMEHLEDWGQKLAIPVHTQIRVATDINEAIIATIAREHINLLVMTWKSRSFSLESILGNGVDSLIKQIPCALILIKLGNSAHAFPAQLDLKHRWLIPSKGGESIDDILTVLPPLANLYKNPPEFQLCHVCSPKKFDRPALSFKQTVDLLKNSIPYPISSLRIPSMSVSEAIVHLLKQKKYSLVFLQVNSHKRVNNTFEPHLTEAIAKRTDSTVIIFFNSQA